MIALGIETSGRAGSVALLIDGLPAGEIDLTASGRRHARTLVPEIADLLKSRELKPSDIQLLAVSIGPGSFTGLRVGVACAKTYAYAMGCPLIGVDTFLAVATAQPECDRVWVIDNALRGDVFAGEYQAINGIWTCVTPAALIPLSTWREQLRTDHLVTGPGLSTLRRELEGLNLGNEAFREPHARDIVQVGAQLHAEGHSSDPWALVPFYMRRSAAEEKADEASATAS
ncbi:tRNA (adenosine(37)-N6)-threonylcarbamoyltransferase complex dimerization subunit type 1 TsaB [Planctomicrobium sp. SH527]|uniref:tRNA (adenosine(37)-N6)-threonylcarbamoyltransferase complex dimerization subunit type 1 TsaB n=1 Tax=Planctomicrobium sp. SH527 TaxID=3448123 RepID=UPI003F5B92D8